MKVKTDTAITGNAAAHLMQRHLEAGSRANALLPGEPGIVFLAEPILNKANLN